MNRHRHCYCFGVLKKKVKKYKHREGVNVVTNQSVMLVSGQELSLMNIWTMAWR